MLLFLFLVATATIKNAAAIEITTADKNMLIAIRNKFQCCFEDERKPNQVYPARQYAVVYYGNPNPKSVNKINFGNCRLTNNQVFLIEPDYTLDPAVRAKSGCSFVAAKLKNCKSIHTEKSCLWSFATIESQALYSYTRCPQSKNRNIYLYTYHNPCSKEGAEADQKYCTNVIKTFAEACGNNFKHLIIGYEMEYKDTAEYCEKAINTTPNVGITKFVAQGKDCKTAAVEEHCKPTNC